MVDAIGGNKVGSLGKGPPLLKGDGNKRKRKKGQAAAPDSPGQDKKRLGANIDERC